MASEKLHNTKPNLLFNKEKRQAVKADVKDKPAYLNQRNIFTHFIFGPYVLLPILSSLVWLGGLLAMIGLWTSQGKPKYRGDEATVVFVSDGKLSRLHDHLRHHPGSCLRNPFPSPFFPLDSRSGQPHPLHLYNRPHRRLLHRLALGRTMVEAHGPSSRGREEEGKGV